MTDISERQFERVVTNFNQQGITVRAAGSGRSRISSDVSDVIVAGLHSPDGKRGKHLSQREVAARVGVAQSSVCRVAKRRKIHCYRRVRAQVLTSTHREKRLVLCRALYYRFHADFGVDKWKQVWFSDEATVSLSQPVNRQNCFIYRAVELKRLISEEELVFEHDYQGPKVLVYAAVSWYGKTRLHFSEVKIDQAEYRRMLLQNVFPDIAAEMNGAPWTWQ